MCARHAKQTHLSFPAISLLLAFHLFRFRSNSADEGSASALGVSNHVFRQQLMSNMKNRCCQHLFLSIIVVILSFMIPPSSASFPLSFHLNLPGFQVTRETIVLSALADDGGWWETFLSASVAELSDWMQMQELMWTPADPHVDSCWSSCWFLLILLFPSPEVFVKVNLDGFVSKFEIKLIRKRQIIDSWCLWWCR